MLSRTCLRILCLLLLLVNGIAVATTANPLHIGVSFAIPPYVIQEEDRGIEVDLLRATFQSPEYELHIHYLPLARGFQMLESGKLDGIINVRPGMIDASIIHQIYYSQPVITFHNQLITLSNRWPEGSLTRMDQLTNLKLLAFQRATLILGQEFATVVAHAPYYAETAKQPLQVRQLLRGRIDGAVMEARVFNYYLRQAQNSGQFLDHELAQPIARHALFPPTVYHFAFRDAVVRDHFNNRLEELQHNGGYQKILARYDTND
jgi:polar amino acid transport system substrate-binding protein